MTRSPTPSPSHSLEMTEAQDAFDLSEALLIYANAGSRRAFASQHRIGRDADGAPLILAGQPLSRRRLRAISQALDPAPPLAFIPAAQLARSADALVWWTPARMRDLCFDLTPACAGQAPGLAGRVVRKAPVPAHVLAATRGALYLFALADNARPTPETVLMRSPILNVHRDGLLCWGNVAQPDLDAADAAEAFERAAFDSWNTHPNDDQATMGGQSLVALWDDLVARAVPEFPVAILPACRDGRGGSLTLAGLIEALRRSP